jgi:toxin YoeB
MAEDRSRDDLWFSSPAWEDYLYWQANDPTKVTAINNLIEDIRRTPFKGLGKPEPLKENWAGYWSRRINLEHRLVYRLVDMDKPQKGQVKTEKFVMIQVVQCRYHYNR